MEVYVNSSGGSKMAKKRIRKILVLAIADCRDCDWEETDYRIAQKEARKHAMKTGHTVDLDTGYIQTYNQK